MEIKFWGVRGSIPSPGPTTARYGGNTSCIALHGSDDTLVVFDSGTGIRLLGDYLLTLPPRDIHLFLTHTHWDHIQGFPFFRPAYRENTALHIYAAGSLERSIRATLTQQMVYSVFPVHVEELEAQINYHNIDEESIKIGGLTITPRRMNHPITSFGYKVQEKEKTVFYTGDHEQFFEFTNTEGGDNLTQKYDGKITSARKKGEVEFVNNIDLLIADSQYTDEEYIKKVGYGHSTINQSLDLAIQAEVKHLVLFHHEPTRTDEHLDELLLMTEKSVKAESPKLEITAAKEGNSIVV